AIAGLERSRATPPPDQRVACRRIMLGGGSRSPRAPFPALAGAVGKDTAPCPVGRIASDLLPARISDAERNLHSARSRRLTRSRHALGGARRGGTRHRAFRRRRAPHSRPTHIHTTRD